MNFFRQLQTQLSLGFDGPRLLRRRDVDLSPAAFSFATLVTPARSAVNSAYDCCSRIQEDRRLKAMPK